jgi:amino acid adenylation domain-containing protein
MPSHTTRIAALSKEKQALLLKRIKDRSVAVNRTIGKRTDFSPCPLSFAQKRLWFLTQMEPDSPFYNMAGVVRIQGNLNIPVLEQALNEVIRRHEALRTSFSLIGNEARQIIAACGAVAVAHVDLTGLTGSQQESIVRTLETQEAHWIFDLERTPLLRAVLLALDGERHALLVTLHHIVADEWSLRLFIKEIGAYYQAFNSGLPSSEPEPPIQYADFAVWQRRQLQGEFYAGQLAYWRRHLEALPAALELPTDRLRPPALSYRGADYDFELNQATSAALVRLSRQADTTLFAVIMAAFNVLLARYSGQDDICVGYPVAGRNRREIENLIGFFVNTLVLRTDLSGNPTFLELLSRVRKNILEAQNNQDLPFERLVEELKLERELNHTPLFQVMLVYQNAPMAALNAAELHFDIADAPMKTAKFDLTLNVSRSENNLRCGFNYCTDLFDEATVARMASHFQHLLTSIADGPDVPVSELTLLSVAEKGQLLHDWNATAAAYPKDRYIHQLFEAQAETTPAAVAVRFAEQSLTYSELNRKANQLAHYLRTQGVGPEVLVGLCLERSLELVIGLLGVLKAGGAYVPLDPAYPQERLEFMLQDVRAPVVLTQAGCREKIAAAEATVLCLDSEWELVASASDTKPVCLLRPENLAYVIYTSGSTGQPKGAGVPHQGILNRLQWMQEEYGLTQADKVLQKTPYSFDVSIWEFFWPLMTGAQLVMALPDGHRDSFALIDTINRRQVTTVHFVPSMLQAFLDTPGVASCTSLKRVICSGEALPADLAARCQQLLAAELHNLYGPTEASVDVSYWAYRPGGAEAAIPIGRPIANIRLYVLDRQLNPVPVGVPGELHIGGIGLGRGYLNRPGLTAEKFIPDPFGQEGGRLYKTGDLVRYRPDGNVDYFGRIDHQVKIRGFRIELGEIEARLVTHPCVRDAVVIAREDHGGDKRLVAYLVAQDGAELSVAELRDHLAASLADYMLPAAFVFLPFFPLTTNGKLDRRALPAPDGVAVVTRPYEAPEGLVELTIAGIWQELLGLEQVGRHDHFFELGGHSLMAVSLIERLRQQGLKAEIRMVFAAPTLIAMADAISRAKRPSTLSEAPPNLIPDDFARPLSNSMTEEFRI